MKMPANRISFTLLLFLLSACAKEKQIRVNSLKDVLTNLAPAPQVVDIDPAKEIMLKGDRGTAVYIPADAFQFADGATPTGNVSIQLKECYSIADMIGENLHTTSYGRILETTGMIYFNATSEGKQLIIKADKAIVVGFPKNQTNEEMDLFYDFALNDTISTWVVDYKMFEEEQTRTVITTELVRGDNARPVQADSTVGGDDATTPLEYPIEITPDLYDYHFRVYLWTSYLDTVKLKGTNNTIIDFIEDQARAENGKAREFFDNDWRLGVRFNIDENGFMKDLQVSDRALFLNPNYTDHALKIALDHLRSAPSFDVGSHHTNEKDHWSYELGISSDRSINWQRFKAKFRDKFSAYKNKAIQKLDQKALDYYMFSATNMGWINCDRFWDTPGEKTNFVVNAPKDTKVQIVFKDIRGIMNGLFKDGKLVFPNVPTGRAIKVIGISYANGKPTMSVAETTIDNDGFELTGFKEFSLDELETELNSL